MQDVRLIGRYETISLAGFPVLSRSTMYAFRQIWGQFALCHDSLKMSSLALRVSGPNALMKAGGISSGPAAPFLRMHFMVGLVPAC